MLRIYIIAVKMQFATIPKDPTPVLANLDLLEMGTNAKVIDCFLEQNLSTKRFKRLFEGGPLRRAQRQILPALATLDL